MSQHYGSRDPLASIVSDGLIFYIHPQLKASSAGGNDIYDLVNSQYCTGTNVTYDTNHNFVFNGSTSLIDTNTSYIDVGGDYTLSSSVSDYTLEAWIYVESSQGTTTTADSIIGSTSSVGVGMQVGSSGGLPRINFGARSTSNFYGSTFSYNTWNHVVWAHNYGVGSTVYMNGSVDVTASGGSYNISGSSWGNITIGNSSGRVTGYYDGKMGPIRMYNRALNSSEVTTNFAASRAKYGI